MANFQSGEYRDRLLEIISNQLQMANLQRFANKNTEAQVEKLRLKIINQRAELKIDVDGV
jgi:hypothetical protein